MSDFHSFHKHLQSSEDSQYVDALKRLQELDAEEVEQLSAPSMAGGWIGWR